MITRTDHLQTMLTPKQSGLVILAMWMLIFYVASPGTADEITVGELAESETVFLKNGDHLTGHSQGLENRSLQWQLPIGGVISIPLQAIERLQYSAVELPVSPDVSGPALHPPPFMEDAELSRSETASSPAPSRFRSVRAKVAAFDSACELALESVSNWTKRLELGGQFLDGNSDDDFLNVVSRFEKQSGRRFTQIDLGGQYGQSRGDRVANRWYGNTTFDFDKDGKWILYLTSKNEYAEFENLDYRGTLSGGLGYRFYNGKRKRLIARLGPAVTYELFDDPRTDRTTTDIFAELEVRWPIYKSALFEHKLTFRPSIDNLDVFRLTSLNGILFQIDDFERWKLKLGLLVNHNSQPSANRLATDYTSTISLVYTRK